ncbi:Protein of uncharacterised function (DUF1451) [Klebsiella pneumoniae subsp. ozaenae]|uniref:Protein of uncharacterized function (DUF1451) n=2 Tax=Klebsiella pneumoniae TaxID=573 RepID=A0A378BU54_KLEPO|nr:Protein of uncharacterised function (DUF1451) [Klebsiella pneumoniae subsp. ozaenae]
MTQAREKIVRAGDLTQSEIESVIAAVKRDLEEFARSYEESHEDESDSVFMRVIKESLWQELADITDKTQLEWREVFQDLNHHGVYHSGEVVGLGNLVCEKCHYHLAVYTPDVLPRWSKMWPRSVPASALRALSVRKTDARGFAHRGLSYFTVVDFGALEILFSTHVANIFLR